MSTYFFIIIFSTCRDRGVCQRHVDINACRRQPYSQLVSRTSAYFTAFLSQSPAIPTPVQCGAVTPINLNSGVVVSPRFPSNYPSVADCRWTIQAPQGAQVTLEFTAFDLEPVNNQGVCSFDELKVGVFFFNLNLDLVYFWFKLL